MPEPSDLGARLELLARDEAATVAIAQGVARFASRGDVIGLSGALGSGKTTFARAFIRNLTQPDEEVPSPTFTLVQTYAANGMTISHFDLYRLEAPDEVWELGIEEAYASGVTLIEWPERLGPLRPAQCLLVTLAAAEGGPTVRSITLAGGASWRDRLRRLETALAEYHHG